MDTQSSAATARAAPAFLAVISRADFKDTLVKPYRCVVRRSEDAVSQTLIITAADCRAAASTALLELHADATDWIEVWDGDERVLLRRKSNLYPRAPIASASLPGERPAHATYCRAPR
jgi:hypothetical protein